MSHLSYLEKLLDGVEVEWKPVGEIFDLKMDTHLLKQTLAKYWANGEVPWFRMEDIRTNGRVLKAANEFAMAALDVEVDRRSQAFFPALAFAQPQALAEMAGRVPDQQQRLALGLEGDGRHPGGIVQQADAADGGRGQDGRATAGVRSL